MVDLSATLCGQLFRFLQPFGLLVWDDRTLDGVAVPAVAVVPTRDGAVVVIPLDFAVALLLRPVVQMLLNRAKALEHGGGDPGLSGSHGTSVLGGWMGPSLAPLIVAAQSRFRTASTPRSASRITCCSSSLAIRCCWVSVSSSAASMISALELRAVTLVMSLGAVALLGAPSPHSTTTAAPGAKML